MIETKDLVINGSTYSVTQMPALRALRMQARLFKLFAPSVGQMIGTSDKNSLSNNVPKALALLGEQLDEKTFSQLVIDLLEMVRKDGIELKSSVIDLEFSGKLNELFKLLEFVIEVNYGDFLSPEGIITALLK